MEPPGQLLGHGASSGYELLAGDHLADHEVAQELAQVLNDALRSEHLAEGVLMALVEGLLPALEVQPAEALVGVAVQAVGEELDHVLVVSVGPRRQASPLVRKERREKILDARFSATHGRSFSQTGVGLLGRRGEELVGRPPRSGSPSSR